MKARLSDQRGQTGAEYMGVLLVVAAIVGALFSSDLDGRIGRLAAEQVCRLSGGQDCATAGEKRAKARDATPRTRADRDGDGISNADEARLGSDPDSGDSDTDGIPDGEERRLGTDPVNADSDGDGIPDRQEQQSGGKVSPTDADSDDDGLADGEEVAVGTDPSDGDSDGALGATGDGLSDAREIELGTDPNAYDTDGDFFSDGYEVERGMDPLRDQRSRLEKLRDSLLDDPIGAALPGGGAGKGAKKVIDDLLKGGRKLPSAASVREAAEVRRERLAKLREQLRKARERRKGSPGAPATEIRAFADRAKLDDHFRRHGDDFGAESAEEYAEQAAGFLRRSQREGLPAKVDANGVVRVYDPATNTFGVYGPDGVIKTLFKPKAGQAYFDRQPGQLDSGRAPR